MRGSLSRTTTWFKIEMRLANLIVILNSYESKYRTLSHLQCWGGETFLPISSNDGGFRLLNGSRRIPIHVSLNRLTAHCKEFP